MGYVVVVFAIINTAALVGVMVALYVIVRDMPMWVETAIADEVRKQDDRIEKRTQRAQGRPEDEDSTVGLKLPKTDGKIQSGVPYRRP